MSLPRHQRIGLKESPSMLLRFCLVPQNLRKQALRGKMKREREESGRRLGTDHWHRDQGVGIQHSHIVIARALSAYPSLDGPNVRFRQVLRNWLALPRIFVRCTRIIIHLPWLLPASASATYSVASQLESVAITCGRPYHCSLAAAMLPATENTTAYCCYYYTGVYYTQIPDTVRHWILNSEHFTQPCDCARFSCDSCEHLVTTYWC
jgi:hypothetical protein